VGQANQDIGATSVAEKPRCTIRHFPRYPVPRPLVRKSFIFLSGIFFSPYPPMTQPSRMLKNARHFPVINPWLIRVFRGSNSSTDLRA